MQIDSDPRRLSSVHERHQTLNARFGLQGGWFVPEIYTSHEQEITALRESVGLVDISARGKLIIKGTKVDGIINENLGETPTRPGDVIEIQSKQILVAKLTSDELIILTSPGAEQEIGSFLETEIASHKSFVSVIDQTSGLVGLQISGPKSIGVMRKLCALDFNPTGFPNLYIAQSSFAKVRATIIRHDQGNLPTFELYADRSYAGYLWDAILDAGKEFAIRPVGWEAIENPRR
jgi:heterotetrameric sarcosine oxidase gamma subunit